MDYGLYCKLVGFLDREIDQAHHEYVSAVYLARKAFDKKLFSDKEYSKIVDNFFTIKTQTVNKLEREKRQVRSSAASYAKLFENVGLQEFWGEPEKIVGNEPRIPKSN